MSRNSGASGSIIIPSKLYSQFSKSLIAKYLEMQEKDIALFNAFLQDFLDANKGKRVPSWYNLLNEAAYNHFVYSTSLIPKKNLFLASDVYHLINASIDNITENKKPKLLKKSKIKTTAPLISFEMGESSISLDKSNQTLSIHISFNNHAVEQTQEIPFFKEVISQLHQIKWTRGSGGEIYLRQEEDEMSFNPFNSVKILYHFGN